MKLLTVFTVSVISLVSAAPLTIDRCDFTVGQIVKTSSGPIAGHAAAGYPEVSEYLGIPFGQPPIGDLRFAAPVKYASASLTNASSYVCSPSSFFVLEIDSIRAPLVLLCHHMVLLPQSTKSHYQTSLLWDSRSSEGLVEVSVPQQVKTAFI